MMVYLGCFVKGLASGYKRVHECDLGKYSTMYCKCRTTSFVRKDPIHQAQDWVLRSPLLILSCSSGISVALAGVFSLLET